ncbi:hypothetical protein SKAU_G00162330 [Synaphobranchus kaupii]|uniref:Uncharacterized protein n=1 Tax=Synaphobranchus kaupii TaxID=118154 RepID=A0A9Q1FIR8_SYNKA|nr:hypothetical protein SKAU_G00162330 [Synaphobranchus kaupii]
MNPRLPSMPSPAGHYPLPPLVEGLVGIGINVGGRHACGGPFRRRVYTFCFAKVAGSARADASGRTRAAFPRPRQSGAERSSCAAFTVDTPASPSGAVRSSLTKGGESLGGRPEQLGRLERATLHLLIVE